MRFPTAELVVERPLVERLGHFKAGAESADVRHADGKCGERMWILHVRGSPALIMAPGNGR